MRLRAAIAVPVSAALIASAQGAASGDAPAQRDTTTAQVRALQLTAGSAAFNGEGLPAAVAGRVFNADSCSACHNGGLGGLGPARGGPVPTELVIQLDAPPADGVQPSAGDPIYGRILNTAASARGRPEGKVTARYSELDGRYYPDGMRWSMRVPSYKVSGLSRGPLAPSTVVKPRLAPALFGVGLLELVPTEAAQTARNGAGAIPAAGGPQPVPAGAAGRFGWQGSSTSIRDQTTKAFAREMGLTSMEQPDTDCTAAEGDCIAHAGDGPQLSAQLVDAVVAFERTLAVPPSPTRGKTASEGPRIFTDIGCAGCHRPSLPIVRMQGDGSPVQETIAPYTDLRLHDLGRDVDDRTVAGARVPSKWRTAPLWGLGYRIQRHSPASLLHDGRARSVEEAVLWHGGEAGAARKGFLALFVRQREEFLRWLESL